MKLNIIAILISYAVAGNIACAEGNYNFNSAFLDGEQGNAVDLSWVNKGIELPPGKYKVNIYLNDIYIFSQNAPFNIVKERDSTALLPCLTPEQITAMGIDFAQAQPGPNSQQCYILSSIFPDAQINLEPKTMTVYFTVPQRYMLNRPRGYISPASWEHGIGSAWLNYVVNGSHNDYRNNMSRFQQDKYFASLNSGINLGAWRLRDYSTWTRGGESGSQLTHVRTYLQRDVAALNSQLYLGEAYTSSQVFDSVGLRGFLLATDDNMLPSSRRGYAPEVRGIARSNATVTVRQNDNVIYQTPVPPGEFVLKDLYPTASGGDLAVSIQEENGQVTRYTIPFASVPNLMRAGQAKYSVGVGRFHPTYNQNDPLVFQSEIFYGWRYGLTFYSGAQFSDNYHALALGMGQNMGRIGAYSLDVVHARSQLADGQRYEGDSIRLRYSKLINDYGTRLNFYSWRFSTSGFYSLSDTTYKAMKGGNAVRETETDGVVATRYRNNYNLHYSRKAKSQVLLSQNMKEYGALSLSWDWQSYWQTSRATESVQLSYNNTFHNLSWHLGFQRSTSLFARDKDNVVSLSLSMPLGNPAHSTRVHYGTTRSGASGNTHSVGMSGYLPGYDNISYNINQRHSTRQKYGTDLAMLYQGAQGNYSAGYSQSATTRYLRYGVSGGMVLHEDGLTLSQPLGNTNILVKAPGASRVAIRNHKGVETDRRGFAVIPYATPYRVNRVELDVTTTGENVEIDQSIVNKVPTEGALVRATITTRLGMKAIFFIRGKEAVLPFGTIVALDSDNNITGIVGDNGSVYLSGLPQRGRLVAKWGKGAGASCTLSYQLNDSSFNPHTGLYTQELTCR